MQVRSRSIVVLLAATLLLANASIAVGTNWGSTGTPSTGGTNSQVSLLPDRTMSVKRVNLTTNYSGAVYNRVTTIYNSTDLVATAGTNDSSCATSNRVCTFDSNYGNNNLYGWAACHSGFSGTNPTRTCSHQWVRFNLAYTPPSYQRLACHELGHTVGLRHGSQTGSCMYSDITVSTSSALTTHDIAHIDARY